MKRFVFLMSIALAICFMLPRYLFSQQFPYELEPGLKWSHDKEKTWIQLDEPIPEGPKSKKWPWLPAEQFPFKPPHTGEELVWYMDRGEETTEARFHDMATTSFRINKRGHLILRDMYQRLERPYDSLGDLLDLDKIKPGQMFFRLLQIYGIPAEKRGAGFFGIKYQATPEFTKYPDMWVYAPALRRNRRVAISDRQDFTAGADWTYDEIFIRWPWEETYYIIGTDVLYEVAGKKEGILWKKEHPWNPFRDDGGLECYVILGINKDPKYYLSKRIDWIERTTKIPVRGEHYDRKGELLKVWEIQHFVDMGGAKEWFSPEMHRKGRITKGYMQAWSIDIDHRTLGWSDERDISWGEPWIDTNRFFQPAQMLKEEFWREKTRVPFLKGPEEFPKRPPLYRDKFPKYRKIVLPDELEEALKKEK